MSKQANTKSNPALTKLAEALSRYGAKSIEANHSIMLAEQSKVELKECARVELVAIFGTNWHEIPTFNPELDHNKDKDKKHKLCNQVRIKLQESQKAGLVAKYGADDKGNPVKGNPDSAWNEIKALQKAVLSQPDKDSTKKQAVKSDKKRATGRDANQVFADAVLTFSDYVTRQTKKGLNGFEADSAPLLRDLNKLIVKHGIKTGTTRK